MLFGCAAQYSSIKSDFQLDNTNNGGTVQIIVGSPQKILSALSDIIDQEFIVYSRRINADNGSLLFKGKGTGALRGDVQVTIKLKQTAGADEKGETIKGYSFDVLSEGIGFNSSMFPQYAINNINEAFLKSLPEYNLSLVRVNNPKIEKYQIQQEVFVKGEDTEKKPDITLAGGLSVDVDMHIPEGEKAGKFDIAVIIGNKNYKNIPNVEYADRDAVIMKEYLIRAFGYDPQNILFEENAGFAKFNELFGSEREYKGKLYKFVRNGVSKVFIYYAGHGAPDLESQEAYFVPVDANPEYLKSSGYSLQTFYTNLSKIPAKKMTVILDTCFSGNSEKGMLFKNISPAMVRVKRNTRGRSMPFSLPVEPLISYPHGTPKRGILSLPTIS